jgi:transposase
MEGRFCFYVGIDWATQNHEICLIDADGKTIKQKTIEHSGSGIAQLIDWFEQICGGDRKCVAVGIEIPHGAIVESLSEKEFAVFSINPKQLDRFRGRHSVSGAKDDSRDAFVLAASLRTDQSCFHRVCIDDARIIRLRELSRFDDDPDREMTRLTNQLREQLTRYYPQMLRLGSVVDDPWIWDLLELAPTPQQGHDLTAARAEAVLRGHRIRRISSADIMEQLGVAELHLAPGAIEAASEHMLFLLPRLRLIHQQRLEIARRIQKILNDLSTPSLEMPGDVNFCVPTCCFLYRELVNE